MLKKILVILVVVAIAGSSSWYFANAWKWDGMYEVQGFVLDNFGEPRVGIEVDVRLFTPEGTGNIRCANTTTDSNGWYYLKWDFVGVPLGQQTPGIIECTIASNVNMEGPYKVTVSILVVLLDPQPADNIRVRQDMVF